MHRAVHDASQISERTPFVMAQDGYRLSYRVWSAASPAGTIVLLPGLMSHALWFQTLGEPLARAGLHVVGADRRGTGFNLEKRGDVPSAKSLLDDLRLIIERERVPNRPLYLLGWCWGAVLAVNFALEYADSLDGLMLVAPGIFSSRVIQERMQRQHGLLAERPHDNPCMTSPVSEDMFTDGPSLQGILEDDHRLKRFTPRFYRAMFKLRTVAVARLEQVSRPILLVLAERDAAVDNAATLHAFKRVHGAPVTIATCESQHGIQFDAPEQLLSLMTSWLEEREQP